MNATTLEALYQFNSSFDSSPRNFQNYLFEIFAIFMFHKKLIYKSHLGLELFNPIVAYFSLLYIFAYFIELNFS